MIHALIIAVVLVCASSTTIQGGIWNELPKAEVTWIDAQSRYGWKDKSETEKWPEEKFTCRSIGYLVYRGENKVILIQTESPISYADAVEIPTGCIEKIEFLVADKIIFEKK